MANCAMCETGKNAYGDEVFQQPETINIRGTVLLRHRHKADQMFFSTCAGGDVANSNGGNNAAS